MAKWVLMSAPQKSGAKESLLKESSGNLGRDLRALNYWIESLVDATRNLISTLGSRVSGQNQTTCGREKH